MSAQAWLQIILTLLAIFLVSIPLGGYMARIVMGRPIDRIFDSVDNVIYFLIGRRVAGQAITWRTYTIHMLLTNLVMAIIIYLVLSFQNHLPLNQLNFSAADPLLAFNTAISFITNTNWQAYVQGAVQTFDASVTAHTLQAADQTIVVGPVASQGTIELIGTNGGGFYNANAAHPFQNPTPLTNIILIVLMASLPASIIVTFGEMIGNRRQAWVLYGVLGTLLVSQCRR
jgi:K+-transporting ATPase A subunit